MNDLSDDERNLLRYYAETERIIHGLVRVPLTSTCGEAQARYVVGSREGLTPDLLWHDAGWARQTRAGVSGATAVRSWVQLRVDGSKSRVQVRRGGHSHGITALMIGGRIAHDRQACSRAAEYHLRQLQREPPQSRDCARPFVGLRFCDRVP